MQELLLAELLLRAAFANDLPVGDHGGEDLAAMWGGEVVGTPLDCDEDHFEKGATLVGKCEAEREDARRFRARASEMEHGPVRADALRRAGDADRRAAAFASRRSLARRPSRPRRAARPRRPGQHRRRRITTSSSTASAGDGSEPPGLPASSVHARLRAALPEFAPGELWPVYDALPRRVRDRATDVILRDCEARR